MFDRRDVLVASATALTASLIAQSTPAFAQSVTVPDTKRGFVERPGCRIYYEVTGSGPAIIFAHGAGSNHMTWWQQVAHLSDRYTCIAFSHRGYPPSSEIGIPDPNQYAGDLAALIEHLQLPDVRLVAQSMGGWTCLEYVLKEPRKVRALVLTSTCGSIDRASIPLADPKRLTEWDRMADAARADMTRRGISPPAGRANGQGTAFTALPLSRDRQCQRSIRSRGTAQAPLRDCNAPGWRAARLVHADALYYRW